MARDPNRCRDRQLAIIDQLVELIRSKGDSMLDWGTIFQPFHRSAGFPITTFQESAYASRVSSRSSFVLTTALVCEMETENQIERLMEESRSFGNRPIVAVSSTFRFKLQTFTYYAPSYERQFLLSKCYLRLHNWLLRSVAPVFFDAIQVYAVHVRFPDWFKKLDKNDQEILSLAAITNVEETLKQIGFAENSTVFIASQISLCSTPGVDHWPWRCMDSRSAWSKLDFTFVPESLRGKEDLLAMYFEQAIVARSQGLVARLSCRLCQSVNASWSGSIVSPRISGGSSYSRVLQDIWHTHRNPSCGSPFPGIVE